MKLAVNHDFNILITYVIPTHFTAFPAPNTYLLKWALHFNFVDQWLKKIVFDYFRDMRVFGNAI